MAAEIEGREVLIVCSVSSSREEWGREHEVEILEVLDAGSEEPLPLLLPLAGQVLDQEKAIEAAGEQEADDADDHADRQIDAANDQLYEGE